MENKKEQIPKQYKSFQPHSKEWLEKAAQLRLNMYRSILGKPDFTLEDMHEMDKQNLDNNVS
jgi:hypothetical protein